MLAFIRGGTALILVFVKKSWHVLVAKAFIPRLLILVADAIKIVLYGVIIFV